jgi:GDP-L-fucose synthase
MVILIEPISKSKTMKILITGASGMVGSYLSKLLPKAFTPSSKELNLLDTNNVERYMKEHSFDYVIHLAAYVGSLHDNIENRTPYFDQNILMNTILTKYSYESGVRNFLGILSTCIYPDNINEFPIHESKLHDGSPHIDLMSYAYAKRSHAVQIEAYKQSFNVNYNYLIPCNLYGIVSQAHEGRSHFINDLIFKIIESKKQNNHFITLFGDGSPLRQFMHASDFAKIINIYINYGIAASFNVAPNTNMTINEMALCALEACDAKDMSIIYDDSKPNGQHRKDVDTEQMKLFIKNYKFKELKEGIKEIYEFYSSR